MILLAKISYNDPDSNTNVLPNFTPNCTPGNHFKNFKQTHNSLTNLLVYLVFFLLIKSSEQSLNIQINMLGQTLQKNNHIVTMGQHGKKLILTRRKRLQHYFFIKGLFVPTETIVIGLQEVCTMVHELNLLCQEIVTNRFQVS